MLPVEVHVDGADFGIAGFRPSPHNLQKRRGPSPSATALDTKYAKAGRIHTLERDDDEMTSEATHEYQWGSFLSQFHWQGFATLTFKQPVSSTFAERAVAEWVTEAAEHAYGYVGFEKGWGGGRLHCHALLGGIYSGPRSDTRQSLFTALTVAKSDWRHGHIQTLPYDPKRGAAWYVSKQPDNGIIIGTLSRHRKR